jgi:hypothetical protein
MMGGVVMMMMSSQTLTPCRILLLVLTFLLFSHLELS